MSDILTLCPDELSSRPYTLATYALVHGSALHAVINLLVIAAAIAYACRLRCVKAALGASLVAVVAAAGVFCIFTYIADAPESTLSGASAPAFALAAFVCMVGRKPWLALLLALLAVAGIFGPNSGGGAAHCTAVAVGVAGACLTLRRRQRSAAARRLKIEMVRLKVHTSGYASLSNDERRLLSSSESSVL